MKDKQLKDYLLKFVAVWSKDFLSERSTSNMIVDLG